MKKMVQKKTMLKRAGIVLLLLSALTLGACGTRGAGSKNSNQNDVRDEAQNGKGAASEETEESSGKKARTEDLASFFEYTLNEEDDTVLLTNYIGEDARVTVYDSYVIDGKEYKTELMDGIMDGNKTSPFRYKHVITSIAFEGSVKLNNGGYYFEGLENLETVDLSGLDTSECTQLTGMFCYCTSLSEVDLSALNTEKCEDLSGMFGSCESLTEVDLSVIDTSHVKSFYQLFRGCENLTTVNLEGVDTSSAVMFESMFLGCHSLTSLDVSGFDVSSVTNFATMFSGCEKLEHIDVSNFDTSSALTFAGMFQGCKSLTSLQLDGFETSSLVYMESMFKECERLTELDMSSFTGSVQYCNEMFKGCTNLTAVYVNQAFYDRVHSEHARHERMFDDCGVSDFTVKN